MSTTTACSRYWPFRSIHNNACRSSSRRIELQRRRRGKVTSQLLPCVLLLVFLVVVCLAQHVQSDWIDPDTPEWAFTTEPINVRKGMHHYETASTNADTRKSRKRTRHPTMSPRPTQSPAPSNVPSNEPSSSPTMTERMFELVFSDEFNVDERSFHDGADPKWTALDKNDYTNDALHYYSPLNVNTKNGSLVITTQAVDTDLIGYDDVRRKRTRTTKHFRSGMVQSWNKFCFTGGIVEAQVQLPGSARVGGLWPAFWLLGNLARHTYVGSSEHIWPWSSAECTEKAGWAQQVSGCDFVSHYGMQSRFGRGAPEMDIFEVQPGNIKANTGAFLKSSVGQPFASASFQVAPGRSANRPGPGEWPGPGQWYNGLLGGENTSLNILFYGNYNHFLSDLHPAEQDYWSDAISMNRQLNDDYFAHPHVFRLEWDVPSQDSDGYLHWFLDGELVFAINGTGVKAAGLGAEISSEPSYILLNTAVSKQWGFPNTCPTNCPCKQYNCHSQNWKDLCGFSEGFCDMMVRTEPEYKIDWVRVYQNPNDELQKVGCSTPERPTRRWIEAHAGSYKTEQDALPLKPIQRGGSACTKSATTTTTQTAACGGTARGQCARETCTCHRGWTGPQCLVPDGHDPIVYDQPDKWSDVGFVAPSVVVASSSLSSWTLLASLLLLTVLVGLAMLQRHRLDAWTPLPNVALECKVLNSSDNSNGRTYQQQRSL